jgi:D-methionine transport system substrate-binding protein
MSLKTLKKQFRRHLSSLLLLAIIANPFLGVSAFAPSFAAEGQPIVVKVGTTSDEPRIWNAVQKNLDAAGENIKIEIVYLTPGNPNEFLAAGEIDLNAFQHYAYLKKNSSDLKLDLTAIGDTLIVPLSLFSKRVKSLDELKAKQNLKIIIPDDPVNQARALLVLRNAGLIEVDEAAGTSPLMKNVKSNPLDIQFIEITGAQIPRSLDDADAGIINCGYATDAGFDPLNDPIFKDTIDLKNPAQQPFINIIVARTADKDNEIYKKVVDAYHQPNVADAIREVFKNAAIPAWE